MRRAGVLSVAMLLLGCDERRRVEPPEPAAPPIDGPKCSVRASDNDPLIVEWPAGERGSLETRLTEGVVAVEYANCEMRVLRRCRISGARYDYAPFISRKEDRVRIENVTDLYAKLPLGAVSLEAELETHDALALSMTMVGMYRASVDAVRSDGLSGECEGATHVVLGVTVGAYEFVAERRRAGGAGVKTPAAGAGASVQRERDLVSRDGDSEACGVSSRADAAPPDNCGALLRLEVAEIRPAAQAKADVEAKPEPSKPKPAPTPAKTETKPKPKPKTKTETKPKPPPPPVKAADVELFQKVHFGVASTKLRDDGKPVLDEVAKVLLDNPSVRVVITGHCDSDEVRRSKAVGVSGDRAKAVRDYLVGKGVASHRLTFKGYGADTPIVPNDIPSNRALNRRVEFRVVE